MMPTDHETSDRHGDLNDTRESPTGTTEAAIELDKLFGPPVSMPTPWATAEQAAADAAMRNAINGELESHTTSWPEALQKASKELRACWVALRGPDRRLGQDEPIVYLFMPQDPRAALPSMPAVLCWLSAAPPAS